MLAQARHKKCLERAVPARLAQQPIRAAARLRRSPSAGARAAAVRRLPELAPPPSSSRLSSRGCRPPPARARAAAISLPPELPPSPSPSRPARVAAVPLPPQLAVDDDQMYSWRNKLKINEAPIKQ